MVLHLMMDFVMQSYYLLLLFWIVYNLLGIIIFCSLYWTGLILVYYLGLLGAHFLIYLNLFYRSFSTE